MGEEEETSAAKWVPETRDLRTLQDAARACQGCELYKRATQVVFGEGPRDAKLVMIGEQPGDEEDRKGHPFVGPAGRVLDKAIREAGLEREKIYVTNAVKHFKFEQRGKRRIHRKPSAAEVRACRPWLQAELALIEPEITVCLGVTAVQSLLGPGFRLTEQRGIFFPHPWAKQVVATVHPSAILRASERYEEEYQRFLRDMRLIANKAKELRLI
jgi:uracil-DNA glycosylase family protein